MYENILKCPNCHEKIHLIDVSEHILNCENYKKIYLNNITRSLNIQSVTELKVRLCLFDKIVFVSRARVSIKENYRVYQQQLRRFEWPKSSRIIRFKFKDCIHA